MRRESDRLRWAAAGLLAAASPTAAGAQITAHGGNGVMVVHMLTVSYPNLQGQNVTLETTPNHKFLCAKPGPLAPTRVCQMSLINGQVVELRAWYSPALAPPTNGSKGIAASGKQWGGDCQNATGGVCTLTMSANRHVLIDFSKQP